MIVSHVSAPHNPCQDDNVRHQALTAPNPSLNSWLCVSLSRTNTQWCARMTAGGSSAPASSVFTTATELVGSDIRVRCPPVSFLPSGHSHTAQPSTLSTQLLRLKQYSSTPARSTPALTTTRTIINCDLYRSPIYFQNNITTRRREKGSRQRAG